MSTKKHISTEEHKVIQELLDQGYSIEEITHMNNWTRILPEMNVVQLVRTRPS